MRYLDEYQNHGAICQRSNEVRYTSHHTRWLVRDWWHMRLWRLQTLGGFQHLGSLSRFTAHSWLAFQYFQNKWYKCTGTQVVLNYLSYSSYKFLRRSNSAVDTPCAECQYVLNTVLAKDYVKEQDRQGSCLGGNWPCNDFIRFPPGFHSRSPGLLGQKDHPNFKWTSHYLLSPEWLPKNPRGYRTPRGHRTKYWKHEWGGISYLPGTLPTSSLFAGSIFSLYLL